MFFLGSMIMRLEILILNVLSLILTQANKDSPSPEATTVSGLLTDGMCQCIFMPHKQS